MSLKNWFKERIEMANYNCDENEYDIDKIKKSKKRLEEKYNFLLEDINEITIKYTKLLEQKSKQFDLYVEYQNQCTNLVKEKRELKKRLAETNEMCNSLKNINNNLTKKIEKLERKIKRLEKNKCQD